MKIIYHDKYLENYPTASVECPERVRRIYTELQGVFDFITPKPGREEDLELVHSKTHIEAVKRHAITYKVALLAVGGAILTAELARQGTPGFGLIRPPGHHASPNSSWGFCFFNNMAIAIEKLRNEGKIRQAFILDIDLHFGDGTVTYFKRIPDVSILNISTQNREEYLEEVLSGLRDFEYDMIGVSAGFDLFEKDWGGVLTTEDYRIIGELVKEAASEKCDGRRFALLEGGYYLPDLGKNVKAFLEGLK
ncbi:MAG: histone deacetylase family protein [Candidatus Heimdallarchaeota archaeon]